MIPRLVDRRTQPDSPNLAADLLDVFKHLAADLGRPNWAFDLVLVDDETMAELNHRFRGKSGVTDVLSFSYLLDQGPDPCDLACGQAGAFRDLWVDQLTVPGSAEEDLQIGEVILAPAFVSARCRERQWPVLEELPMLLVHGGLHLLGWDHRNQEETDAMQNLEEEHLAACGLPHPLRKEGRLKG